MNILVKNQEEYDKLMKIYQDKGWYWSSGSKPTETKYFFNTPISIEYKDSFTFIKASINSLRDDITITFSSFLRKFKMEKLL